jgi:hypothetical protein
MGSIAQGGWMGMTDGWFSEAGLARLHDVMTGHVDRGAMPGLIALCAYAAIDD